MGNVTIYDENVEWVFSTAAGSLNSADNTNPHTGLIDLSAFSAQSGDSGTWTSAVPYDARKFIQLSLWLDPSGLWSTFTSGVIFFFQDQNGTLQGNAIEVMHGVFGFDATNKNYQNVIIPLLNFAIPAGVLIKSLVMTVSTKTTLTFFLDTITLVLQPPSTVATDPQSLLTQSNCYQCNTPGEWQLMKLALLRQILLATNPMAATDPQSLVNQGNCYNCFGPGLWPIMELALLAQIAAGGGTAICITGGTGAPVGTPPCNFSVYIQQPPRPQPPGQPNFGIWVGDTVHLWGQAVPGGPWI